MSFLQERDVIPAEAGIQRKKRKYVPIDWIPASNFRRRKLCRNDEKTGIESMGLDL